MTIFGKCSLSFYKLYSVTFWGSPTQTMPCASPQNFICLISHLQNHKLNLLQEIHSNAHLINRKKNTNPIVVGSWEVMPHARQHQSPARTRPVVSTAQCYLRWQAQQLDQNCDTQWLSVLLLEYNICFQRWLLVERNEQCLNFKTEARAGGKIFGVE